MKVKVKIPQDGDLKLDDVMNCDSLTAVHTFDGQIIDAEQTHPKWVMAIIFGLERRIPVNWVEKVIENMGTKQETRTDPSTNLMWQCGEYHQVLDIFEKRYPNDCRPRCAITAAKAYLKEPSHKTKKAAAAADADAATAAAARAKTYTKILTFGFELLTD